MVMVFSEDLRVVDAFAAGMSGRDCARVELRAAGGALAPPAV
jgi:hypothetical protein